MNDETFHGVIGILESVLVIFLLSLENTCLAVPETWLCVANGTKSTIETELHHPLTVLVKIRIIILVLTNISSQNSFGKF